jgi:hypothetical protein
VELVEPCDIGMYRVLRVLRGHWLYRSIYSYWCVGSSLSLGKDSSDIDAIIKKPESCDENTWIYEHVRQFIIELNLLLAFLRPHCTSKTCPVMNVHPENYRCITHSEPRDVIFLNYQCHAFDYMLHNLNLGTSMLQNPKNFPSRYNITESSIAVVQSLVKRLCRIVAHCAIYHKEAFLEFEEDSYLGKRFYTFLHSRKFLDTIQSNCIIREYYFLT